MPQENSRRKVKSRQQMIQALELRAAGASFRQIGEALSVSKPRAFRIVRKALDELVLHCQDTAERVRQLELYRLDRITRIRREFQCFRSKWPEKPVFVSKIPTLPVPRRISNSPPPRERARNCCPARDV
jgi:hypothetical protein